MTEPTSGTTRQTSISQVGVVVIGRNEGERLQRCLKSLRNNSVQRLLYVDSGSTDNSVQFAQSLGYDTLILDTSKPFTMARGRNTGFHEFLHRYPDTAYVQFVDGDCEVEPDWIATAITALDSELKVAAVAGRRRERFPGNSIYNHLADVEWNQPPGLVKATGGDLMIRTDAFLQSGGFNDAMIAGEEAEMYTRVRAHGWLVRRLDEPMTIHDAAMTRFSQWWRRTRRTGHAYAESVALHGGAPEYLHTREVIRIILWAAIIPALFIASLVLAAIHHPAWLALSTTIIAMHIIMWLRIAHGMQAQHGKPLYTYATFIILGKYPECLGILTYILNRIRGKATPLIEYHRPPVEPTS